MSMWGAIGSYISSASNYGVTNMNNMFNFIISVMEILDESQNKELMDKMILHLGKSFYKKFQKYLITKLPNSNLVRIVNRVI